MHNSLGIRNKKSGPREEYFGTTANKQKIVVHSHKDTNFVLFFEKREGHSLFQVLYLKKKGKAKKKKKKSRETLYNSKVSNKEDCSINYSNSKQRKIHETCKSVLFQSIQYYMI